MHKKNTSKDCVLRDNTATNTAIATAAAAAATDTTSTTTYNSNDNNRAIYKRKNKTRLS